MIGLMVQIAGERAYKNAGKRQTAVDGIVKPPVGASVLVTASNDVGAVGEIAKGIGDRVGAGCAWTVKGSILRRVE